MAFFWRHLAFQQLDVPSAALAGRFVFSPASARRVAACGENRMSGRMIRAKAISSIAQERLDAWRVEGQVEA